MDRRAPTDAHPEAAHLARVAHFFEQMTPQSLDRLGDLYHEDARFKDPFHTVQGLPAIHAIYAHMYQRLDRPRFVVRDQLGNQAQGFLTWEFIFALRGERRERIVHGSTHFRFAPDGRVQVHRDYWDAAEEFYEHFALLGGLMRWLRRRIAAPC